MSHYSTSYYVFIKKTLFLATTTKKDNFPEAGKAVKKDRNYNINKKRSSTHAHSHISATDTGKKIITANRTDISGTRMVSAKDRSYKLQ